MHHFFMFAMRQCYYIGNLSMWSEILVPYIQNDFRDVYSQIIDLAMDAFNGPKPQKSAWRYPWA